MDKILFITGTNTGVGKTVVTALLLAHLRRRGIDALAMKPFATGTRDDVRLLQSLQRGVLTDDEANPFYFSMPVTPLLAARRERVRVKLPAVLEAIRRIKRRCEVLLVEGAGGLLSPLGVGYASAQIISALPGGVIVVAHNNLGTVNQSLMTWEILRRWTRGPVKLVVNNCAPRDLSSQSNSRLLQELVPGVECVELPFLGGKRRSSAWIRGGEKKLKKTLATVARFDILGSFFRMESSRARRKKKAVDSLPQRF